MYFATFSLCKKRIVGNLSPLIKAENSMSWLTTAVTARNQFRSRLELGWGWGWGWGLMLGVVRK